MSAVRPALAACLEALAAQREAEAAPFEPFLDLAAEPTADGGPAFDLLLPGGGLGVNCFDRAPAGHPRVRPVLEAWCREVLDTDWLATEGREALRGLRLHGGPAHGAHWRCKLYASGADAIDEAWRRLHVHHGLGAPTPPPGTYALGLDLTAEGPRRLRSYQRPPGVPTVSGLPETLPVYGELGVAHRVWCATRAGHADPDTRTKGSLSWIFGPRVPADRLLDLGRALEGQTGIRVAVDPATLALVDRLSAPWGVEVHAVAWEIDTWADRSTGSDGLITLSAPVD